MKFLQKLGKALMLPVAVLPICGILMGIGYRLCPATMQGGDISGVVNLIFCPFAEQEPGCCLSNGCYQNQRSDYWWFRKRVHICGESPCDLSSCSKHRAAFRDRYSTVHRFVNVFF